MYQPAPFVETNPDALHGLITAHPLGLLMTLQDGVISADPVPFLLDPQAGPHGTLKAHVARANPLWKAHPAGADVTVIFQSVEHYVSPGWYPSKAETGKVVPTWNYALVEVRGPLIVHDDALWLRAQVGALTERHEGARSEPWRVEDAPPGYIDAMLRGIVGIEIPISSIVGKFKLSQNRSDTDRAGVVAGLGVDGADAMAQMIAAQNAGV
jgi:transcriptional regulator